MSSNVGSSSDDVVDTDSFDFRSIWEFTQLVVEGNFEAAVKLMAEDVEWHAFDGRVIKGRQGCQELFQSQRMLGQKRRGLTQYVVQPRCRDDPDFDENDVSTFVAKRLVAFEKPDCFPARVVQTTTIKKGKIWKSKLEVAPWEPGLEPLEVLRRFASLRAGGRDDLAVLCCDPECEWRPLQLDQIWNAPAEMANIAQGRDAITQLWQSQKAQGMMRHALTDWNEEDASQLASMSPDKGGKVFSRKARITGKNGMTAHTQQSAQVVNGYIVTVAHCACE